MGRGRHGKSAGGGTNAVSSQKMSDYTKLVHDYNLDDTDDFYNPTSGEIDALLRRKEKAMEDDMNDDYMNAITAESNGLHVGGEKATNAEALVGQMIRDSSMLDSRPDAFFNEANYNNQYYSQYGSPFNASVENSFKEAKNSYSSKAKSATSNGLKQYYNVMAEISGLLLNKYKKAKKITDNGNAFVK